MVDGGCCGVVGVGGGRMIDGWVPVVTRSDGTMVTWEGDHMAASMSYPCPAVVGGLPRSSPACRSLAAVMLCVVVVVFMLVTGESRMVCFEETERLLLLLLLWCPRRCVVVLVSGSRGDYFGSGGRGRLGGGPGDGGSCDGRCCAGIVMAEMVAVECWSDKCLFECLVLQTVASFCSVSCSSKNVWM